MPVDQLKKTNIDPFTAGRQARQCGDLTTAIACFREAIARKPDHVPAHNNLATALQADGDLEGALTIARRAIELDPQRAVLYSTLGSLHWLQGDVEQAIAAYRQAIALDPALYLAHYNLAKALAAQDQFQPAVAAYQQALQGAPDQAQAQIQLEFGQLYHRYGFLPQAVECYKAALRLAPSAPAYNALGAALQDWGNITLAQESYRRALPQVPKLSGALRCLCRRSTWCTCGLNPALLRNCAAPSGYLAPLERGGCAWARPKPHLIIKLLNYV